MELTRQPNQKLSDTSRELSESHVVAEVEEGPVAAFAGREEEPYDPERASLSSGEIRDDSENFEIVSVRNYATGPVLPPGILSLIQKEREAKTAGERSIGDLRDHGIRQIKSSTGVLSKPASVSSLSSVTDAGIAVSDRSKRHRRKNKRVKDTKVG